MKRDLQTRHKKAQHSVLLRLPLATHQKLAKRATEEERTVAAHLRHLINQDLEKAA